MKEEKLKKKIQDDLMKFWSGEIDLKGLAELYGTEPENVRQYILFETSKLIQGEIKQFPALITDPLEETIKIFNSLCNLFEDSENLTEKLSVARELREYIKLMISFYESGVIEDKEKKLDKMKQAYREIF